MVDRDFADKHIRRFGDLKGFPHTKEGLEELSKAMREFASYTDALEFADSWIRQQDYAPKPMHIYSAATHSKEPSASNPYWGKKPPITCGKCCDQGTVHDDAAKLWARCVCENGEAYPQILLEIANAHGKHVVVGRESEDLDEVRRVLARAIAQRATKPTEGAA